MSELKFYSSVKHSLYISFVPNIYLFLLVPPSVIFIDSLGNLKYSVWFVSLVLSGIILGFILIYGIFVPFFYPLIVNDKGIQGYDMWGNNSFVAWAEIDRIEPYQSFGVRYFRTFCQNSTVPLWIPLFLQKQKNFEQTVFKLTSKTNPLHQALINQKELFAAIKFHGKPKQSIKIESQHSPTREPAFIKINQQANSENSDVAPWMIIESFALPDNVGEYGFCVGDQLKSCSRPSLIENIRTDKNKKISLVWSTDKNVLVAPEEVDFLFNAVNARDKNHTKHLVTNNFINLIIWGVVFFQNPGDSAVARQVMLFNWIAIAVIPFVESSWDFYEANQSITKQKLEDRIKQSRYTTWVRNNEAFWTKGLTACITVVALTQLICFFLTQIPSSIETAGIVKPAIREGEFWRLFSGTLLHGNLLHFAFNIFAFYVLGKLIETTISKYFISIVFVSSALIGSICSLIFIPDVPSVGASGGIMGLLGFLLVFSVKARKLLPKANTKMLIKAALYTFLAGLLAKGVVDNPAHLGGFLAGIILGLGLLPQKRLFIPLKVFSLSQILGWGCFIVVFLGMIFTILKLILVI